MAQRKLLSQIHPFFWLISLLFITSCNQSANTSHLESKEKKQLPKAEYYRHDELPMQGTYNFEAVSAEWNGIKMFEVQVIIGSQNKIRILRIKDQKNVGNFEIIDEGVIMKHKSGKWIIGNKSEDAFTDEFGGCSGGPSVIDFEEKKFWMC